MKKGMVVGALIGLGVLISLNVGVSIALAQGEVPFQIVWSRLPEGQQGPAEIYVLPDYGLVCIVEDNGEFKCVCPCDGCETASVAGGPSTGVPPTQPPPDGTQPPPPTVTNTPPTLEPTPTSTPVPESGKCNQGRGNGQEGCDPGNSNNNQDSNDEPGVRGR